MRAAGLGDQVAGGQNFNANGADTDSIKGLVKSSCRRCGPGARTGFSEEEYPQGHGRQRAARAPRRDRAELKSRTVIPHKRLCPLSLEGEPCGASAPLGLEECTAPAAATRAVAVRGCFREG